MGQALAALSHGTTTQEAGARMRHTDFKATQLRSNQGAAEKNTEQKSSSCSPNIPLLTPRCCG